MLLVGIEPGTYRSRVRRFTTAPQRSTSLACFRDAVSGFFLEDCEHKSRLLCRKWLWLSLLHSNVIDIQITSVLSFTAMQVGGLALCHRGK